MPSEPNSHAVHPGAASSMSSLVARSGNRILSGGLTAAVPDTAGQAAEPLGIMMLVAALLLGCGAVGWDPASEIDMVFVALAAALSLGTAGLAIRRWLRQPPASHSLEERIEVLEDLRWQARGDADYLKALLDEQSDILIRRDLEGRVKFANRAFCRAFEISPAEIIDRPFAPVVLDRDATFTSGADVDDLPDREPGPSGVMPIWASPATERIATSRGPRWIKWSHKRVDLGSGAGWEVQTMGRDVTDIRRHEQALAAARDQAQAADRAKSRFLASMSHEIRTPMNGILGMTGLMRETALSPEQRTYAAAIQQSATTLLGLIDEILDFSKVEAGRIELRREPVDIAACVQDIVELLAPKAFDKGLEIAWSLAPDMPRKVLCDETRLRQVLLNLVGNAVKFTETGGVSVWLGAQETEDGGCKLQFVVRDTGPGLGEDERQRIFMEFERAASAGRTAAPGTGLGLAIAKRLACSMNGDIGVVSTLGDGATFWLSLALERLGMMPALEVPETLAGRHVMIVAPAGIERRTVANFLRALDLLVTEADCEAAERLAGEELQSVVDFAFFDASIDAGRARRIIDGLAAGANDSGTIRSAVIASPAGRDAIERFRQSGIEHFLVRPVRPTTLVSLLDGSLSRAHVECSLEPSAETPHETLAAARKDRSGCRILLAEDNEINALLSMTLLGRLGYEVVLATDGQQAIDRAAEALAPDGLGFDAVLMDLNMPALNGFEASARIVEMYEAAGAPPPNIVAVTANAFEEDRANCLAAGMQGYLAKPFEAQALEQVLDEVLSKEPAE